MVFEGRGLQNLLKNGDIRSKYALRNRAEFWLLFFRILIGFVALLVSFSELFGPLLASWDDFGRLLGDFGHRLPST